MITAEQRAARALSIGSSDMAAILGLDPFRSAWDVWAEKTGKVDSFAGNEATDRGNLLEPAILNWAEQQLGEPIVRAVFCLGPDGSHLAANLDAECPTLKAIIEAKSTTASADPDEWGEAFTDQVPERVIIQTHVAMICTMHRTAYVPVLLPAYKRFEFRMYQVEFNPDLAEAIDARATQFWNEHVVLGIPPTDSVPSLDVLKRMRREPNKVVPVADELVDHWIVAKAAKSQAEGDLVEAQAKLLASMGDAEGGECTAGRLTYLESHRKAYAVDASSYRTLRLKARK